MNLIYNKEAKIAITTGRPLAVIKNLLPEELYKNVFKIALNGSLIQSPEDKVIEINAGLYNQVSH